MMKRKNGVNKAIIMVALILVTLANCAIPAFAAQTEEIKITELENFVFRIKNFSEFESDVTIQIKWFDEEGVIYAEEITKNLKGSEETAIDTNKFFNSEKTQRVETEIITNSVLNQSMEKSLSEEESEEGIGNYVFMGIIILIVVIWIPITIIINKPTGTSRGSDLKVRDEWY